MLQAFIFDVDGTLADTEQAHLAAFNHAFEQEGLGWHWDTALYTELLNISGGKERMLHHWQQVNPGLKDVGSSGVQDTINRLHEIKTAAYESAVNSGVVTLRPGVFGLYTKELHPSAARQLALSIEDPAARWVGSVHGASLEEAVKVSLKSPAARNLEVVGQYIIHGSDQTTKFRQYLTGTDGPNGRGAMPTDKWEDVFDDAVDEVVNGKDGRYGALLDQKAHIVMRQLPDKNGVPHIRIDALTSDGDLRVATLSGDDVFTLAQAKRDKMKTAGKTPSGEVLRGRMPRNNLKNIYD